MLNHMGTEDNIMWRGLDAFQTHGHWPQILGDMGQGPSRLLDHLGRRIKKDDTFRDACNLNQGAGEIACAATSVQHRGVMRPQACLINQPAIGGGISQPLNLGAPMACCDIIGMCESALCCHAPFITLPALAGFRGIAKNPRGSDNCSGPTFVLVTAGAGR